MNVIEINGITKNYPAKKFSGDKIKALDNVSFNVGSGEIFGLLGPNGAGKTTLVKILLGITFSSAGKASIFDKPVADVNTKRKVGYLPENHQYPNYLTGEQVIDYFGRLSGLSKADLDKTTYKYLKIVGMDEWGTTKIKKYSKGMMQRLGLAQAMISNPDLIFLDEPTDGVDPIGRKEIRDVLLELKNQGKTIFLNSHLLSEIELICDRVAILNKGALIKEGSVEDITTTGNKYIFTTSDLTDEMMNKLLVEYKSTVHGRNEFSCSVNGIEDVNRIIDCLRASGILIHGVNREKNSLESMFINLIEQKN
ncbi:MAG: ABC transporter ATP-binding protein [Bacteroidetes bacterium]|nr:ABC transporter ATP-binding protein [Bacteroidota bacterium]